MKKDLFDNFTITQNDDLKRFEFKSHTNKLTSYTVNFLEADNLDDAKIVVYKAVKINYPDFFIDR